MDQQSFQAFEALLRVAGKRPPLVWSRKLAETNQATGLKPIALLPDV